jgi:demethoxyubiquinone hydroxylase (CLK1/Coq7/Cat5 family)
MPVEHIPEPPAELAKSSAAAWIYLGGVITTAVGALYGMFKKASPLKEETKVISTTVEMIDSRQIMVTINKLIEISTDANSKIEAVLQRMRDDELDRKSRADERARIFAEGMASEARERTRAMAERSREG